MQSEITIADLMRNGTVSAEMAAVLWAALDPRTSFLSSAVPRLAGKSTTSQAALALRPAGSRPSRCSGARPRWSGSRPGGAAATS
jgi:Flp pilus assembly CpaF family ATPase